MTPSFSEVFAGIFVGRTPRTTADLPKGVRAIVACAGAAEPPLNQRAFPGIRVVACQIPVEPRPLRLAERRALERAARDVKCYAARRQRVYVACPDGLQRSALVAGLAIMRLTGFGPVGVIQTIRSKRARKALAVKEHEAILLAACSARVPRGT